MRLAVKVIVILLFWNNLASGQSFGINTDGSVPVGSAILDIKSNAKGLLIPRMTQIEKTFIQSPATGLLIYQTGPDSSGFYYYNGNRWTLLVSTSNTDTLVWKTQGNYGTQEGVHFIGTKDNKTLNFRVNDERSGRIDQTNFNTYFGYLSGPTNTYGLENTAIGAKTLFSNSGGTQNTAVGTKALNLNNNGSFNVALGGRALESNYNGMNNTAIGYSALLKNTEGYDNFAAGVNALQNNGYGNYNTAIGNSSLYNNGLGLGNTAIGYQAIKSNISGNYNTAIGYNALTQGTIIGGGTAIGAYAMERIAADQYGQNNNNVAVGYESMRGADFGTSFYANNNTAVGAQTLRNISTGYNNTANGYQALQLLQLGNNNTAHGYQALNHEQGSDNTAIGYQALYYNTGLGNTAIGSGAGLNDFAGSHNVAIGYMADMGANNLMNAIAIGEHAVVDISNSIQLGNASILQVYAGVGAAATFHSGVALIEKSLTIDNQNGNTGFTNALYFGNNNSEGIASARLSSINSHGLDFYTNSLSRMSITNGGNIGIGTTNPTNTLEVNGSTQTNQLKVGTGTVLNNIQSGTITLGANGSGFMSFTYTFPTAFAAVPRVVATPRNQAGTLYPDTFSVTTKTVTTTSVTFNIQRTDTNTAWGQLLQLDWIAVQ